MRRWARLLPAFVVGACSAGELALPAGPETASATAILRGARLVWSVDSGATYTIIGSTAAGFTAGTALVTVEGATPPLTLTDLAAVPWRFRVLSTRDGFRAPESAELEVRPLAVGTAGLVPLAAPAWITSSADPAAHFGYPVLSAGDVNEDGFADVLVGSMASGSGGTASLFLGGPAGLEPLPAWTLQSPQLGGNFSKGMSTPDVDGDGRRELLIAATEFDGEGRAWIYEGTATETFFATTTSWTVAGGQLNCYLGRFTASLGDVNGDGLGDFVVESHALDSGQTNEGYLAVWYGTTGTIPGVADWDDEINQADAFLGYSLSPRAGDANGDGYDDLLAGAYQWDGIGGLDAGAAFLYRGSALGLEDAPSWSFEGQVPNENLGVALSFAGDVDGDGYDDIVAGGERFGFDDRGKAYFFRGGPAGPELLPSWTFEGEAAQDRLGLGVGAAGDVNRDGFDDLLVGAYSANAGGDDAGRVYLFLGGPSGPAIAPSWSFTATDVDGFAGGFVGSVSDVNGDGSDDFAVGNVSFEFIGVTDGRARVFLGTPIEGPSIAVVGAPVASGSTVTGSWVISDPAAEGGRTCSVDWGDGGVDTAPCAAGAWTPSHDYGASGPFTIRLRVTNAYGLEADSFALVHVR